MKCLARNKRDVYYANFKGNFENVDSEGNFTGESSPRYTTPVKIRVNVSEAMGNVNFQQYGRSADYQKTIVTDDFNLPINEESVFWINNNPSQPYDYYVHSISDSLNSRTIRLSKVK